jgi:hypothetical protein
MRVDGLTVSDQAQGITHTEPPIWRRFRPVGVAGSAEPDWPFWGRLGSLCARAGWRQILLLVLLPLHTWLIQLLNTALYWATMSNGHAGRDLG